MFLTGQTAAESSRVRLLWKLVISRLSFGTHFHVSWASNGEASFHKSCWDQIILATRTRKSVKTEMLKVSPQEKTLIKEAKKTAEFKYSYRKIRQEAKRVSDMIKSSSHCVAFTGNCICSN